MLSDIGKLLYRWADGQRRRRTVRQLKKDILPHFLETVICPYCLYYLERD